MRNLRENCTGSVIPVLIYIAGFFTFGLVYLLMNDIVSGSRPAYYMLNGTDVQTYSANTFDFGNYLWIGLLIVYIIGGAWWLWRMYTEQPQQPMPPMGG